MNEIIREIPSIIGNSVAMTLGMLWVLMRYSSILIRVFLYLEQKDEARIDYAVHCVCIKEKVAAENHELDRKRIYRKQKKIWHFKKNVKS